MLVRFSWFTGLLATLVLMVPAVMGALPTGLPDEGVDLLGPTPLYTSTLPGPANAGTTIFFEDFSWCEEYPCSLLDGPPMSAKLTNANGGQSTPSESWLVLEGGSDGSGAFTYVTSLTNRPYEVRVQPHSPFASAGQNLVISVAASGPSYTTLVDGGLRMQLETRHLGINGPAIDCWLVPSTPTGNGFSEWVPLNPLCKAVPVTGEVQLTFTVEPALSGGLPDVAIDRIEINRV